MYFVLSSNDVRLERRMFKKIPSSKIAILKWLDLKVLSRLFLINFPMNEIIIENQIRLAGRLVFDNNQN